MYEPNKTPSGFRRLDSSVTIILEPMEEKKK